MTEKNTAPAPIIAMRPREAAKALGISPRTLSDWVTHRGLPCRKVNGVRLFIPSEVHRWLASQPQEAHR